MLSGAALSPQARSALAWTFVGSALGLPVFLSINYVARFAVDVPYWDQWELVGDFEKWAAGTWSFSDAFALHSEHRIFFPRLIMHVLAQASRWDTRWEIWFNWFELLGVAAVLLVEHARTFGRSVRSTAAFIPAAWLVFTLRQDTNLLWGFQIQITLCALAACCALALLDAGRAPPWSRFAGAVAAALVCTFSFGSGLMVWPAGLVAMGLGAIGAVPADRRALAARAAAWVSVAAASAALYFHGYTKSAGAPPLAAVLQQPGKALYYVLVAFGGPLATESDPGACAAAGAVLLALIVLLVVAAARSQLDLRKAVFGFTLVAYSAATVATVTVGRLAHAAGASSRYTTLTLLGVVGAYRVATCLRPEPWRNAALAVVATLIATGLFVTFDTEYVIGAKTLRLRQQMREVLVDWRQRPDSDLLQLYPDAAAVKARAPVLEKLGYSVFRPP